MIYVSAAHVDLSLSRGPNSVSLALAFQADPFVSTNMSKQHPFLFQKILRFTQLQACVIRNWKVKSISFDSGITWPA